MCKTEEKTRQHYFFTARQCPAEAEKIGFAKTHDEFIIDFKSNTTVFDRLAQLVEHRTAVREVAGSNLGQTNTQGL